MKHLEDKNLYDLIIGIHIETGANIDDLKNQPVFMLIDILKEINRRNSKANGK